MPPIGDRARTAEQVALGPRRMAFDGRRHNDQQSGHDCQITAPGIERTLHGHCTRMLLANTAPMPTKASEATNDLLRFCDDRKCGSSGFSVHDRARRWRADQLDRSFLGEREIDEELRIVDLNFKQLRFHRFLERQRKVQSQHCRLRIVVEPIIGRIVECILILHPVSSGEGEVSEGLKQIDIDLGERLQFLAGELALGFGLDPHGRESRKHVVEGPGMTHAGDRAVGGIKQVGLDRCPDVRMSLCLARRQDADEATSTARRIKRSGAPSQSRARVIEGPRFQIRR